MDMSKEEMIDDEPNVVPDGCCGGDPYASLPVELRPRPAVKNDGLRQVTCPGCGLIYSSNRKTDLCIRCEQTTRT